MHYYSSTSLGRLRTRIFFPSELAGSTLMQTSLSQNVSNQVKLRVPRIIHSSWVTYWNGAQPSPFPRLFKKPDYELCKCQCGGDWQSIVESLSHCLHEKSIPKTLVLHHFVLQFCNYHFLWAPWEPHGEGNSYDIELSNESQSDV